MKRMTRQRVSILKCLSEKGRPLSIDEILSYTSEEIFTINLSTIYRNLKALIEEGKIALIDLPGENACYEIIRKEHHHYFRCDKCERMFSINGCPKGLRDIVPSGFLLKGHFISLNGYCQECNL